jgi:hypothetical protein
MIIFKKIKQERPWSSTSKYFVPFHWTLFAILWLGLLTTYAKAEELGIEPGNTTYHGHTIETTPKMLWTSNIIGADKVGDNTIRVKFNDGSKYDAIMFHCYMLPFANGYVFGNNWASGAIMDRLESGLQIHILRDNKLHRNNGCIVDKVIHVVETNE